MLLAPVFFLVLPGSTLKKKGAMTRFFFPPSESEDLALAPVCLWDSDQHYLRGTSWCALTST
jgi:hypothetical protein